MNDFLKLSLVSNFHLGCLAKASSRKLAFVFVGLCLLVNGEIALCKAITAKDENVKEKVKQETQQKIEQFLRVKKKKSALQLLVSEISATVPPKMGGIRKDLNKSLLIELQSNYELYLKLSRSFETDRAQQIYELAMSSKKSNSLLALQKIEEALLLEPGHVLLIIEKVRLLLGKKDCLAAYDALLPIKEKYHFDEEVNILYLQQALCLQKPTESSLVLLKRQVPVIKLEWLWASLVVQQKILAKFWQSVPEEIERMKALDAKYPEISYFEWTIGMQTKNYRVSLAQKYLTQCEEISGFAFRKYNVDPLLCQRTAEVTEDLKNLRKKQGG
jgi:hypothetical protein